MACKEILKQYSKEGKALLATNFYNFETLKGILAAAQAIRTPLILQASASTLHYLGIHTAAAMAKTMLKESGVTGWIHFDHGSSVECVQACLDAGFDSVMIDASESSFSKNIRITKEVVKRASSYGANVEAELGYVAKLGQNQTLVSTSAEDAKRFTEATGVDALAVAIGNAHGFYKEKPDLDFEALEAIRQNTDCALVLHGSSGIPDEQLQKAIKCGIAKINLATETKNIFMQKLQSILYDNNEIDLRKAFPPAIAAVTNLISKKLQVIESVPNS